MDIKWPSTCSLHRCFLIWRVFVRCSTIELSLLALQIIKNQEIKFSPRPNEVRSFYLFTLVWLEKNLGLPNFFWIELDCSILTWVLSIQPHKFLVLFCLKQPTSVMSHWFCLIDPTTDETKRHFIVITAGDQAFRKNCSLLSNLNCQNLGQIIN